MFGARLILFIKLEKNGDAILMNGWLANTSDGKQIKSNQNEYKDMKSIDSFLNSFKEKLGGRSEPIPHTKQSRFYSVILSTMNLFYNAIITNLDEVIKNYERII
jgi:hypothetical protein